jgi:hypothetical protein
MSELEWESRRSFVGEEVSSTFRSLTVYRDQTLTDAWKVETPTLTSDVSNEDSRSSMSRKLQLDSVASNPSSIKSQVPLFSACWRPPDSINAPVVLYLSSQHGP